MQKSNWVDEPNYPRKGHDNVATCRVEEQILDTGIANCSVHHQLIPVKAQLAVSATVQSPTSCKKLAPHSNKCIFLKYENNE